MVLLGREVQFLAASSARGPPFRRRLRQKRRGHADRKILCLPEGSELAESTKPRCFSRNIPLPGDRLPYSRRPPRAAPAALVFIGAVIATIGATIGSETRDVDF